jgi:hypothetical protein
MSLDLSFLPRTAAGVELVAWDGFSYVARDGRTFWSGADPSAADLDGALSAPRLPSVSLSAGEAETLLDSILDGWARQRGYASAARCITYVGDPDVTFHAEGVAMRNARSALWVAVRAAAQAPENAPYTEASVRAFAAQFAPVWPS